MKKITSETVRAHFNDPLAVVHYTRAAHFLGLWKSERLLIERFFPDKNAALLEAGCGSGRVTLGLWHEGYRHLTAFDFAEELVDQARHLAASRDASAITFLHADATRLPKNQCHALRDTSPTSPRVAPPAETEPTPGKCHVLSDTSPAASSPEPVAKSARRKDQCHVMRDTFPAPKAGFDGVLFMFNGMMQIPGRANRRKALRGLRRLCRPGARFLFTTHDRDDSEADRILWRLEAQRWKDGRHDPRLGEFGDRYFEDENGRTFMHLPDRAEILEDLAATGWKHDFDDMRRKIAHESHAVRDFSDECRFWSAVNP